ncbi:YpzG family protein [Alkalihalobacillus sp. AL-G]|uniref:YpzG family protein n=1 Tax=Alkalihalobacillus sp. AL-G TaxID=2926399 RepID=UPI00272B269B|nr:YpzG family protein [Alkalihalobacillus sp. AL-G]WLD93973.1 YpzG family protein [Alkalihalobacillus sp. AL-G]
MGKDTQNRLYAMYEDPFQSPRANPKHSYQQVNGETQRSLHNHVLKVETRKRS